MAISHLVRLMPKLMRFAFGNYRPYPEYPFLEVVEAIKACLGTDRRLLDRDSKTNQIKALIEYDVGVDHSCHVTDIVAYL